MYSDSAWRPIPLWTGRGMGSPAIWPPTLPPPGAGRSRLLNAIRRVELLTEYGLEDEPIAFIAAAEISRDVLVAPRLSVWLFQAYTAVAPGAPWSGKALLAAKELTAEPAGRGWLDERLDELPEDLYVRYARKGHSGAELAELEVQLQTALDLLIERVDEELAARRQLAGVPKK